MMQRGIKVYCKRMHVIKFLSIHTFQRFVLSQIIIIGFNVSKRAMYIFIRLVNFSPRKILGCYDDDDVLDKMLSYRRETALQGTLVLAESGRLELNILLIL